MATQEAGSGPVLLLQGKRGCPPYANWLEPGSAYGSGTHEKVIEAEKQLPRRCRRPPQRIYGLGGCC